MNKQKHISDLQSKRKSVEETCTMKPYGITKRLLEKYRPDKGLRLLDGNINSIQKKKAA